MTTHIFKENHLVNLRGKIVNMSAAANFDPGLLVLFFLGRGFFV